MNPCGIATTWYLRNALIAAGLAFLGVSGTQAGSGKFNLCCQSAAHARPSMRVAFTVPRDATVYDAGVGTFQAPSTIKIVLQIERTLPERRPVVVNFGFPMRELQALRDALARDDLAVIALDQDGRQVLGLGNLIMIESRIDQATASVPARAIFPNDDKRF